MSSTTKPEAVVYEDGSWQDTLQKSATMLDRAGKAKNKASALLWAGAQSGIESWIENNDEDVSAEGLYATVMEALGGTSRKGDASKIKTVALAVRDKGLDIGQFDNLSKAYGEATRLTKTAKVEAEEDDAAEEAIALIEAPKTASTLESAAALLLSKGVDGAVVAILDALGADNEAAHRSFARAVTTEVASRIKAAADAEREAKQAERDAEKAKRDEERAAKQAERDAEKAKKAEERAAKAKEAAKNKPAPAKKTASAKAKPAPAKAKPAPAKKATTTKAKPVAKR